MGLNKQYCFCDACPGHFIVLRSSSWILQPSNEAQPLYNALHIYCAPATLCRYDAQIDIRTKQDGRRIVRFVVFKNVQFVWRLRSTETSVSVCLSVYPFRYPPKITCSNFTKFSTRYSGSWLTTVLLRQQCTTLYTSGFWTTSRFHTMVRHGRH